MKLSEFTGDMEVIQKLATFPNADDGLTAEQLKAKFDQAPAALKEYINNTLVPAVRKLQSKGGSLVVTVADGVADKSLAEVLAAAEEQRHVVLLFGEMRLGLIHADESGAIFTAVADGQMTAKVVMDADGMLSEQTFQLASKEDANAAIEATKAFIIHSQGNEADVALVSVLKAVDAGRNVVLLYEDLRLVLVSADDTGATFVSYLNNRLTTVCMDDDGFLTVSAPSAEDAKTLRVNVSITDYAEDGTGTGLADKTPAEIAAAVNSGRSVCAVDDEGIIYSLVQSDSEIALFLANLADVVYALFVSEEGVRLEVFPVVTPEQIPSKTSQLDNDSGFLTVADLRAKGLATPQMFGAVGDGEADDTDAFKSAIVDCKESARKLYIPAGTYQLTDILDFDGIEIEGVSPEKCVFRMTGQATEREHFIRSSGKVMIKNISFRQSYQGAMFGMFGCHDAVVENCVFQVDEGIQNNGYVDLYHSNTNIRITNCRFLNHSKQAVGGVWVRNFKDNISENIIFDKCIFEHKTKDEVVAVWGWLGTVQDVTFRDCTFETLDEEFTPTHMISLGSDGITRNVTMDHCVIRNNFATMCTIQSLADFEGAVTENIRINNCQFYVSGGDNNGGCQVFGKNILFTGCDIVVDRRQYLSDAGNVFRNCRIDLLHGLFAANETMAESCEIVLRGDGKLAMSGATFRNCRIDFCNVKHAAFLFQPTKGNLIRMDGCEWVNCAGFERYMMFNTVADFTLEFTNCKGITGTVYADADNFTLKAIGSELANFKAWVGESTKHISNNLVDGVFLPDGLTENPPAGGGECTFHTTATADGTTNTYIFSEDENGSPMSLNEVWIRTKYTGDTGYLITKINGTQISYRHVVKTGYYESQYYTRFGDSVYGIVSVTTDSDVSGMNFEPKGIGIAANFLSGRKIESIAVGGFNTPLPAGTTIEVFGR